jgi:segregation and condensation protein B
MSLKAKIEAVIYAAEEPVTLAQLAGLFAEEALEDKRVRDAAAQSAEPANEAVVVISTDMPAPDDGVLADESAGLVLEDTAAPLTVEEAGVMAKQSSEQEQATEVAAPSAEDEKRAARQRDREAREALRRVLNELIADYANDDRGMEIREIAGGYRVGTKPEYHDAVRGFVKSLKPPMKLSLQALETLAVIAYKQPVTAPEVGEIRGVDSAGVIGSLISRKLITTAGRKQVIGRPILYKTTKEFLLRFGLKDVNELPSMEEFEKMAAGELAEPGELPFEERKTAPNVEGLGEAEPDEAVDEETEAEEVAKAQAAVEITDETAEKDAVDLPGIAVEVDSEAEEVSSEEAAEREL